MKIWLLYLLLLRATATSFTGFASLPVVRDDFVVKRAVISDGELNAALAIGQTSPGPLALYVVIVGYFVAGVPGAVAGMLALATPALLAVPLLRVVQRGKSDLVRGASDGIVLASCVLMLTTAGGLAPEAAPTLPLSMIVAAAFATLATTRVSPILVVAAAALVTLLIVP